MSDAGTPAPTTSGRREKVAFRFCRECSNMLYPHEDRINNTLMYRCRTCQATESASNNCVFRNTLGGSTGETAGVTTDVGSDPTLPRSMKPCPKCGENECVFFQSQQRTEDTKMRLFHVCCSCGTIH
ncbi:unnamed protein product [Tuber melanosporum]|uniref:DNA-directed RNA polymerase subunit n=1 Tax=Tuber melanosporum (strain Mel28) TaxID=656061 RepID=D5GJJ3_TUBMM|nr:uncharacterized protein GSTUM_00009040001 [Tuber melanosporum]KAG0130164.1 hypothetical protein HOY82DRAFT_487132 [Tuber indicum]CAZ84686.1 unnamed protein product [Tuber melanosporum]